MGKYATKSFFENKLKDFTKKEIEYFEVAPAPDCCPECEAKTNKKLRVATATKDDIPPFHEECRCDILPLFEDQDIGFLKAQKSKYDSGEFPMKRCPHCSGWIAGNANSCFRCGNNF